ncbi:MULTISPECIES: hypothetical protein [Streptomyces]|uniref:hypothetical protein n=1 Tax=Streptomyces TaxID=1883 RepID=UPI000A8E8C6C|nr:MULTISPECIES: hypothetical protein [Streptomyces]MCH0561243.1 hypothetical protein [Streptomyces sp. MUM 16J]
MTSDAVGLRRQASPCGFDLELRTAEAGDRWTWRVMAARTQFHLARQLAADLHRPSEMPDRHSRQERYGS